MSQPSNPGRARPAGKPEPTGRVAGVGPAATRDPTKSFESRKGKTVFGAVMGLEFWGVAEMSDKNFEEEEEGGGGKRQKSRTQVS